MSGKTAQLINRIKDSWKYSPTVRNILKVSFGDAISKIFSVAIILLLIRGLSILDYANYTAFSGISDLFSGVVGAGVCMALVSFSVDHLSRGKGKPLTLYFFALVFQLVIYAFMAGLCLLFPTQSTTLLFGQPALTLPIQVGLFAGLGALVIQFARSLYQAEEKFNKYIGTLWLVQVVTFVLLAIIWFLHHLSFLPAAILFAVTQLAIGLWILSGPLGGFELSKLKDLYLGQREELKQFFFGSGWLIGYFFFLNLFSRLDVLLLLRFKGREELAIYGVAFQYYSLSLLFLGSIHAVLLPRFSKTEMQETQKQMGFLKRWMGWSAWLAFPIILFDVFGKPLFVWVNGSTYEKSFPIFVIFSVGVWISMMFSPLVNILISKRDFRFLFFLGVIAFVLDIFLNLWLIPLFGGLGAAAIVVLTTGLINIVSYFRVRSA